MRACQTCGRELSRKRHESRYNFARRRYCGMGCIRGRISHAYEDLRWLLQQGNEVYDALRRCGIPTADAAYQWAVRHGEDSMADRLRAAYNAEKAAYKRRRRAA
jgi:hypothetical protein